MKLKSALLFSVSALALSVSGSHAAGINNHGEKAKSSSFYQSPGKPSAPINIHYKILNDHAMPGDEVRLEVRFESTQRKPVFANVSSVGELTMLTSKADTEFRALKNGETETKTLTFSADKAGVYFVSFAASTEYNGRIAQKVFTIPLKFGDGKVEIKRTGVLKTDATGQPLIIHQGEEN